MRATPWRHDGVAGLLSSIPYNMYFSYILIEMENRDGVRSRRHGDRAGAGAVGASRRWLPPLLSPGRDRGGARAGALGGRFHRARRLAGIVAGRALARARDAVGLRGGGPRGLHADGRAELDGDGTAAWRAASAAGAGLARRAHQHVRRHGSAGAARGTRRARLP